MCEGPPHVNNCNLLAYTVFCLTHTHTIFNPCNISVYGNIYMHIHTYLKLARVQSTLTWKLLALNREKRDIYEVKGHQGRVVM